MWISQEQDHHRTGTYNSSFYPGLVDSCNTYHHATTSIRVRSQAEPLPIKGSGNNMVRKATHGNKIPFLVFDAHDKIETQPHAFGI